MARELSIHPGFDPVLELLKRQTRFGNPEGKSFYVEGLSRETVFGHEIEVSRLSQRMVQGSHRLLRYANRQRLLDLSLVHDFGESEKGDDSVFSQNSFTDKQKKVRSLTERIQALRHIREQGLGIDVVRLLYSYDRVLFHDGVDTSVEFPVDALIVKTADSLQGKYRYAQQTYLVAGADLSVEASQPNTFLTKVLPRFQALYGILHEHYEDDIAAADVLHIAHSATEDLFRLYGPHEERIRAEMHQPFQDMFPELVAYGQNPSREHFPLFDCLEEFGHEYNLEDAILKKSDMPAIAGIS